MHLPCEPTCGVLEDLRALDFLEKHALISSSMRKGVEMAERLERLGDRVVHQVLGVECEFLRIDLGGSAAIKRGRGVECERDDGEGGEEGKQRDLFHRSPSNRMQIHKRNSCTSAPPRL